MDVLFRRRAEHRWRHQKDRLDRRNLRDASDPMAMDETLFIQSYRVTKNLFWFLCNILANYMPVSQRNSSISIEAKILTSLNFLATGSHQKPVCRDFVAPMSQQSTSQCITEVVYALNQIMHRFIKFPHTEEERNRIKIGFYNKHRIPGVLGCIDGTLIAIVAPTSEPEEKAFRCRKGYHAINTAIICDSDLKILAICAKFAGGAHDSFVWRSWSISSYVEQQYRSGVVGWLLGDSGYAQKPWLMTPVLHAADNTPEAYYTYMHVRTRVCVERCIGLLKARWRCLLRYRGLHYEPTKCAQIINACAVLHNLCLNDGITVDATAIDHHSDGSAAATTVDDIARQQLIQTLWENRRH